MALAKVQEVAEGYFGPQGSPLVWRVFDITGPASYTVGGEVLAASDLKVSKVLAVLPAVAAGLMWEYDHVNNKMKLRRSDLTHTHTENTAAAYTQNATTGAASVVTSVPTEVTAGSAVGSGIVARIFVIGFAP